ncbi:MAG: hypothetical protein ABII13_01885 [Patescibacteria group bacterium]|nr:hypothetical protein [Patescibacteria group bacterium]MBU2509558.1 hypothetical protein [Patescibacteria group bacterium]
MTTERGQDRRNKKSRERWRFQGNLVRVYGHAWTNGKSKRNPWPKNRAASATVPRPFDGAEVIQLPKRKRDERPAEEPKFFIVVQTAEIQVDQRGERTLVKLDKWQIARMPALLDLDLDFKALVKLDQEGWTVLRDKRDRPVLKIGAMSTSQLKRMAKHLGASLVRQLPGMEKESEVLLKLDNAQVCIADLHPGFDS